MNEEALNNWTSPELPPRVRPRFRKVAIAAFIVVIPIALFTLWDYIEARRLAAAVKSQRDPGEPLKKMQPAGNPNGPDNAARYYEAASALVDLADIFGPTGLLQRLDRDSIGSPELMAELRAVLERNREAEALLQRATELEFYGLHAGFDDNYRWGRLMNLSRLSGLRAMERLSARDPEGAARAILQDLKLVRPLNWNARANAIEPLSMWSTSAARQAMRALPAVLEVNPATPTLERVAREVAVLDQDDAIEQSVILLRAFLVQLLWNEPHDWYARPWRNSVPRWWWQLNRPALANRAVGVIGVLNEYQDLARRPWPDRLVPEEPFPAPRTPPVGGLYSLYSSDAIRYEHSRRVAVIAQRLALTRASSLLLAIERYRRAHDGRGPDSLTALVPEFLSAVPIDPYSGQEMRYRREADRVFVYSVGVNRKDDGGEQLGESPSRRLGIHREEQPPPDIGLMMRVSGGKK